MSAHFCISHPCPLCYPDRYIAAPVYTMPQQPYLHPVGCICPPTSEKTCENAMCPRKGIKIGGSGSPPIPSKER